jgi:hypothetical protein
MAGLGVMLAGLPACVPALAPFADLLQMVGSALAGGAMIPRPGDVKVSK